VRRALWPAIVVFAAVGALVLTTGQPSPGAPLVSAGFYPFKARSTPPAPDPVPAGRLERKLAQELRPHLLFDSSERWRPLEINAFLAEHFADRSGHTPPSPDGSGYLDIHGNGHDGVAYYSPVAGHCVTAAQSRSLPGGFDCDRGAPTAIYYRRTTHDRLWFWDYWIFYRFNDYNGIVNKCAVYCDDHEGDWEGLTIVTDAAARPHVRGAILAEHGHLVATTVSALTMQGGHAVVYVATGTHASYRSACRRHCGQFRVDPVDATWPVEESHDGHMGWMGNGDMVCHDIQCVRPFESRWNTWTARWGSTCHKRCLPILKGPSPQTPARQSRYRCPWRADRVDQGDRSVAGILDKLPSAAVAAPAVTCANPSLLSPVGRALLQGD
jgi:hypothetical protein